MPKNHYVIIHGLNKKPSWVFLNRSQREVWPSNQYAFYWSTQYYTHGRG